MSENDQENPPPGFLSPRISARKRRNIHGEEGSNHSTPKRIKIIAVNDEMYDKVVKYVKKERPPTVTREEKLDILLLQAKLRHDYYTKPNLVSPGRKPKSVYYTNEISSLLHRRKDIVGQVWADYVKGQVVKEAKPPANYKQKHSRVPRCRAVVSSIQTFIREHRITRTKTVARDVLDFLVASGYMEIDRESRNSVQAGLRSVQRFIQKMGYKRGKKKGVMCYRLREENIRKRDEYVSKLVSINEAKTQRIIYMDESYIHKNYQRHDDSLYDPNDEQDLETKAQHKGKRYCFIAAIIDADPSIPVDERAKSDKAELMLDTLDIFEGGKKQTQDYHGMFYSNYFIKWMKTLLDALDSRGITNGVIVMDNAKYHKSLPDGTPKGSWKKKDLQEACERYGLMHGANDTKAQLWGILKQYIDDNIIPVICTMAKDKGHEVLFSPPHHSDLQPIELVWANVKGKVGCQYTKDTTFKDVHDRLVQSFHSLESRTVQGCINKANLHLVNLWNRIQQEEQQDIDSEHESSENSEENSSGNESDDNLEF